MKTKKSRWDGYVKPNCVNHPNVISRSVGLCSKCYGKRRTLLKTTEQKVKDKIRHINWRLKNGEKYKGRMRSYHYKVKYGLTIEEYNEMYIEQKGKCAICKESGKLFVDHNHKTNKIRGLLCGRCNFAIGYAREDEKIIKNALKYLRKYNEKI